MTFPFVILTPTYNRANTLPRVYASLLAQTYQEFYWLIIDDGSVDQTSDLVSVWAEERKLQIEYHQKPNGGKYTALQLGLEKARASFVVFLDSDDELTPNALQVFADTWNTIEGSALPYTVAEIRANSQTVDGRQVGSFDLPKPLSFMDATFGEMSFKLSNRNEMINCARLELIKPIFNQYTSFWLQDQFKCLQESVFWCQYPANTKIRYLRLPLRVFHEDASNRIQKNTASHIGYYDDLVGSKYFLQYNLQWFFSQPRVFIHTVLKYLVAGNMLKIPFLELWQKAEGWRFKLCFVLFFPLAVVTNLYYRYIRGAYWRD